MVQRVRSTLVTVTRLTNEQWGFATNCFACEPKNDAGLRLPFHHDAAADVVTTEFTLDDRFSGAPSYVHGGVSMTILDEAQNWATIACAGKFAVTTEVANKFRKPVRVGQTYTVTASVVASDGMYLDTTGVIADADGVLCVESTARFYVLSSAAAVDALGADVTGSPDASFLRDD
jgi:uncharacterized protein (TIGR00369 family)